MPDTDTLDPDDIEGAARLGSIHVFNHFIDSVRLSDPEREALAVQIYKRFYCSGIWLIGLDVLSTHGHLVVHNPGRRLSPEEVAARLDEVEPLVDKEGQPLKHNPNSARVLSWAANSADLGAVMGSWKQSFVQKWNVKHKTWGTAFRQRYQWRLVTEEEPAPDQPSKFRDPSGALLNVYTYAEGNGAACGAAASAATDVGAGLYLWNKQDKPPFPEVNAEEVARLFLPETQLPKSQQELLAKLKLHLTEAVNRRSVRDHLEYEIKSRRWAWDSPEARALEDEVRRFYDEALCIGTEAAVMAYAARLDPKKHPRLTKQIRALELGGITLYSLYRRRRVPH